MRYYFKKGGATSGGGSKAAPAAAPAAKAAAPAAKAASTTPAAGIKSQKAELTQKREDKQAAVAKKTEVNTPTTNTNTKKYPTVGQRPVSGSSQRQEPAQGRDDELSPGRDIFGQEKDKLAALEKKRADEKAAREKKRENETKAREKKREDEAADRAARKAGFKDAEDKIRADKAAVKAGFKDAAAEKAYLERIGAYQKERTTSGGKYVSDIARGADVSDLLSFKATGAAEIQAKADGLAKERNAAATNYNTQIKQKDAAIAAAEKSKDKTLLATLKAERASLVSARDLSNKEYNAKIAATTGPKNSELSQFNAAIATRIKERQGIETQVGMGGKAAGLGLSGDELEAILTDPTKYGTLSKDYDPYLGQFKADPTRDAAIAATAVALAGKDPAKIAQYKQLLSNYYIQQGLDPLLAKDKADEEVETGVTKETEKDTFDTAMEDTTSGTDSFTQAMDSTSGGSGGGGGAATGTTGGTTGGTTTGGGAATGTSAGSNPYEVAQTQADQQASATTGGATTGGIMPAFYPPGLYQPVYSPYAPVTTTIDAGGGSPNIMSPAQMAQMRGLGESFFNDYMAPPIYKKGGIIRG